MIRLLLMTSGLVALTGLTGCNENYRGYGSGYRPSSGGYSRGYDNRYRDNRYQDSRNRDNRSRDNRSYQQNNRSNPPSSGNRGGGGGGGGAPTNIGDPPANHPGN